MDNLLMRHAIRLAGDSPVLRRPRAFRFACQPWPCGMDISIKDWTKTASPTRRRRPMPPVSDRSDTQFEWRAMVAAVSIFPFQHALGFAHSVPWSRASGGKRTAHPTLTFRG